MKALSKLNSFKVVNLKNKNNKHNEKKIFKSKYIKEKSLMVDEFPNTKQNSIYSNESRYYSSSSDKYY